VATITSDLSVLAAIIGQRIAHRAAGAIGGPDVVPLPGPAIWPGD
jgi:hypothetical protein